MSSEEFLDSLIDEVNSGKAPKWFGKWRGKWRNRDIPYIDTRIDKYAKLRQLDALVHSHEVGALEHQQLLEEYRQRSLSKEHERNVWRLEEGYLESEIARKRAEIGVLEADAQYRLAEADELLAQGELIRAEALIAEAEAEIKHEEAGRVREETNLIREDVRRRRLETAITAELAKESIAHGMLPEAYSDFRHKQALRLIDVQAMRHEAQIKLDYAIEFQSVSIRLAERIAGRLKQLYDERDELERRADLPINSLTARLDTLDILIGGMENAVKGYLQGDNWQKLGQGDPDPKYRGERSRLLAASEDEASGPDPNSGRGGKR